MELLARAIDDDDLERTAIALAALDHPGLDPAGVRARLDELAAVTLARIGALAGRPRLRALLRAFYRELAFHAPDDYADPRLHQLDRVLERRAGSPVSLAVALITIGRRAGVELTPVAFPGHFLVRAPAGALIDPCTGATPIPEEALTALAIREVGLSRAEAAAALGPASARTVALRILENLEQAHEERGERGRALLVGERLLALGGSAAASRRMAASLLVSAQRERKGAAKRRLAVHPRGFSFRVSDEPAVDLRRRRALPLLLMRLAEHHLAKAGHGLPWPALVEAGWPGEKMQAEAAWSRLRTAIRTLRKLGLGDLLITIGSGYLLDPRCELRWEE